MTNEEILQKAKEEVADKYNYKDWFELLAECGSKYDQEAIILAIQKAREEGMQWIPANEKLPDATYKFISHGVLAIAPNLPTGIVTAHYDYSYNHWTHRGDVIGVTHWMEIPALKKAP